VQCAPKDKKKTENASEIVVVSCNNKEIEVFSLVIAELQ